MAKTCYGNPGKRRREAIQITGGNRSGKGYRRRESAMAKNDESETIKISASASSCEKERSVIRKSCSSEEDEGSPIRHILCLKRNADMKRFEETDDCFILDFDPFEPPDISKVSLSAPTLDGVDVDADLAIVAVKGEVVVACRDYPHPRHLCQKFPFETTPHESCCELCYCYVCDSAAPCQYWKEQSHCHALKNNGYWDNQRVLKKQQTVAR